mgnify:CR=1 FL=1
MARETGSQRRARQTKNVNKERTKRVTRNGKVYTVTSTDGGKTWGNPQLYTGKAGPFAMVKNPFKKSEKTSKKSNLKIEGTPGSSKGAMAAQAMAKARIKAGKSTLGDFGSGEDRGMKAAQAEAKKRIAEGKSTVTGKKKKEDDKPKYNRRGRRIN